jgi:hypothetical protein
MAASQSNGIGREILFGPNLPHTLHVSAKTFLCFRDFLRGDVFKTANVVQNPRPLPLVVGLFTDRAQDTCNQQSRANN